MCELSCPRGAEERRMPPEEILGLLAHQLALYTANESSSVPKVLAEELLEGVLYFLALCPETEAEPAAALERGQRLARRQAEETYRLWRSVCCAPMWGSLSLHDTLRSIGKGFRKYDARFFAHRFPCEIDYQPAIPVSEAQKELNYVNLYLRRLAVENRLLCALPSDEVYAVLKRCSPDYRGLLVNLYAPAAANTLARVLLGGEPERLTVSEDELSRLYSRWEHQTPAQLTCELTQAAQKAARALALRQTDAGYLALYAREIAVRAAALRDCGGLRGLFV